MIPENKEQLKIDRNKKIKIMVETPGFIDYFLPYITLQMSKAESITKFDEENIEKSYYKQKAKLDVYKGLINTLEQWLK